MLCALLLTTLSLAPMAHAPKQARESSATTHIAREADKKESTATTGKTQKAAKKAAGKSTIRGKAAFSAKKSSVTTSRGTKTHSRYTVNETVSANFTEKCTKRKGYKLHCVKVKDVALGTFADAYKAKVQEVTKAAVNRLMQQIDKLYRWGGSSLRTGFDCNGLVYCAYKNLVKIRILRTANEVYHLRGAAPIERSELKNGDLIFPRAQGCGIADHIDVYVGNDKFIRSPRTGREIQITSLGEDYWQRHYVGVRRVMVPRALR